MMNNWRKRNRDVDDPEEFEGEEIVNDGLQRKIITVICAVVIIFNIFLDMQQRDSALPIFIPPSILDLSEMFQIDGDEIFLPAKKFQQDLWARIIAIDEFCVDPTRKSEQSFWDTYRGCEEDWYKEGAINFQYYRSRLCPLLIYSAYVFFKVSEISIHQRESSYGNFDQIHGNSK